ncbi:proton-conducting transporter transmembrane domain-containing protein [Tuwongella immobilis]|uniref:NADH:quinone oxidoreductase/Mrp antiporter membrane subunit domain-containing protein n=1 Tax=Tuwongella immobilis TaxID=692036 RepID=A0A6C2YI04_9BACT|nr:proton-conducting transporter membrane subunit [Tuwongella immobilis]VIP01168.1 nadh dehydrogenase : NADH dehydrogenase (Quinone) OS=Pirellula staleyi (strain ATCC 27377 / DSM 6068 / ICPB 4128) GN=Psta_3078 PE=4 SV=1: Oxidored_q1_N: Oxidored_q1 [Tuwongella immobilis]VTR97762.1 nadh dehydrogenase : NADH dehydrogenase (Quinone) OS=Pirellula staleyi (strain ATCC 27377 / DSM 6068 / ICPB 4128) GN=Psta_3078 PE=4 SV=1: Oxidored_q1_N: Oxidored_q1 [Tuwongella immobilis]
MGDIHDWLKLMAAGVVLAPLVLLAVIGIPSLIDRKLSERHLERAVQAATSLGFLGSVGVLVLMLIHGMNTLTISVGQFVAIPIYHFQINLIFDRLSLPLVLLTYVLCGTIGSFAGRYMHREPGYNRFFVLFSLFLLGMVLASLAGTIEVLFTGWELVGLSSALLVAYFHERPAPVKNGMRIWCVYRISDAGLLLAAVVMHHLIGEGDFSRLMGSQADWPNQQLAPISPSETLLLGGLLLLAAMGKSGLVPFSGWLPRAMEGPTPSSAVFYGALSVHLGAFLLLRISPVLDASPTLSIAVLLVGLTTALLGWLIGRVQTDIKSVLSFASLTQVGLIVAEIGLGWRMIPLVHLLGHACLRTLQFIRAPTLLADYRGFENALGERLPRPLGIWSRLIPARGQRWLYRFGLEQGFLDHWLQFAVAEPFLKFFRACDRFEERCSRWLSGESASRPSDSPSEKGSA